MLVDLVLAVNGSYWRKRVDLPAAPPAGGSLVLLAAPELVGVVVGTATSADDDDGRVSVLLRSAPAPAPTLHRDGWRQLL